ncbi:MAG: TRAP transporter small permease [Tistlia sp.]|uniref:TRAP transporter small permease n=1 Tax=Tistlia sp. TaxID=3057121 RepID=UPI0034A26787
MLRLERLLQRTEELAALLLVAALALLIGGQIAFRYLFDDPLSWSEELTTFLLISLTFVAATAVLKRGEHFSIDTFLASLPRAARRIVEIAGLALQAVVMLALAYYSFNLARLYEGTETVVLGIPEEAKAYVMVYCFLSMALHLGVRLVRSLAAHP